MANLDAKKKKVRKKEKKYQKSHFVHKVLKGNDNKDMGL